MTAPDYAALIERLRKIALRDMGGGNQMPDLTFGLYGSECNRIHADLTAAADAIEALLACREDAERYQWVREILGGDDTKTGDAKAMAIAHQLMLGLSADAAIDAARAASDETGAGTKA